MDKENILEASWKYLDLALKKYKERIDKKESLNYPFSDYFTWFIKQGVSDYLKKND